MNQKFKSNTIWIVMGAIVKALIGFILTILTARYLGPSNFGIIGYVNSISNLFSAFASLGLINVLVKEHTNHKDEGGEITGTAIILQIISSLISYVLIVSAVFITNMNNKTILICAFIQGAYHLLNCFEGINYYYQSKFQSKYTVIITLIAYIVVQTFKVFLLITNKGVVWFSVALCLEPLVASICLFITYIHNKEPKLKFSKAVAKRLLKQCIPFILAGTITVLYGSIDKIMLKEIFKGTEQVGFYNVGHGLSYFYAFLLTAVTTSFSAIIYELYKDKDLEQANLRSRQLYFIIFAVGFIASIGFTCLSHFFVPLIYGEAYRASILPTIFLAWSVPFAYVGGARVIQMTAENKQKYIILFSVSTVLLNILFNSLLIPRFGAAGAAFATLISEMFVCLVMPIVVKTTRAIGKNVLCAMIGKGVNLGGLKTTILLTLRKKKETKNFIEKENDNE